MKDTSSASFSERFEVNFLIFLLRNNESGKTFAAEFESLAHSLRIN